MDSFEHVQYWSHGRHCANTPASEMKRITFEFGELFSTLTKDTNPYSSQLFWELRLWYLDPSTYIVATVLQGQLSQRTQVGAGICVAVTLDCYAEAHLHEIWKS